MDEPINDSFHTNTKPPQDLPQTTPQLSYTAFASVIISILSIPAIYFSFDKIATLRHIASHTCIIVTESHAYTVLHNLCAILPAVSVTFGILALIRIKRSKGKLYGKKYAIAGLAVSALSHLIYWILLIKLIS